MTILNLILRYCRGHKISNDAPQQKPQQKCTPCKLTKKRPPQKTSTITCATDSSPQSLVLEPPQKIDIKTNPSLVAAESPSNVSRKEQTPFNIVKGSPSQNISTKPRATDIPSQNPLPQLTLKMGIRDWSSGCCRVLEDASHKKLTLFKFAKKPPPQNTSTDTCAADPSFQSFMLDPPRNSDIMAESPAVTTQSSK